MRKLAPVQQLVMRDQLNHRPKEVAGAEVVLPATLRKVEVMVQSNLCSEVDADNKDLDGKKFLNLESFLSQKVLRYNP